MTRIAPHNGFPWHGHHAVEIYTWVLEGTLSHEDSTGGKGDIRAGELQRMFAGRGIQHQELNLTDDPVRVIQIWFMADRKFSHVAPHYQQLRQDELPSRRVGDGTIWHLIGDGSPMEQHTRGRLSAITVDAGGSTQLEPPKAGEDLFFYVTDGAGYVPQHDVSLDQYDVILARPDAPPTTLVAAPDQKLHALSFYLPTFLS
jgi:redox-sensitive bicupin YhaK (pirin superfamily)